MAEMYGGKMLVPILGLYCVVIELQICSGTDNRAPKVVSKSNNLTLALGSTAIMSCETEDDVTSDEGKSSVWIKHIQDVNGTWVSSEKLQKSKYIDLTSFNESIIINDVQPADAGWYTCIIANKYGKSYISHWIEVIIPPKKDNVSSSSTANGSTNYFSSAQFVHAVGIGVSIGIFILISVIIVAVAIYKRHTIQPRMIAESKNDPNEGSLLNEGRDNIYNVL